jgi:hypothetical protein
VKKRQQGIRAVIVTSDPEDVKNISEHFHQVTRGDSSQRNRIRVVQLGTVDSTRKEAARISDDPEVIISTPERIIDHIRRDHLDLAHVRLSVIDEPAEDEAPGFNADLEYIYTKLPHRPQTCVFVENLHDQISVITALLRRPTIVNRSTWAERQERSHTQRSKERPAVKKQKAKRTRIKKEDLKDVLKDIVHRIHHDEDPNELNWFRKQFRKHVSVFNRGYVGAYLLREYMKGSTGKAGNNGSREKRNESTEEYTSIFVGVGKNRHVYPKDLVELFTEVEGIHKGEIGQIKILDNYSFIEISGDKAKEAIGALNGKEYRGRKLNVNYARKKDS